MILQCLYLRGSIAKGVAHVGVSRCPYMGPARQAHQLPLLLLIEPAKVDGLEVTVHPPLIVQCVHRTKQVVYGRDLHESWHTLTSAAVHTSSGHVSTADKPTGDVCTEAIRARYNTTVLSVLRYNWYKSASQDSSSRQWFAQYNSVPYQSRQAW